MIEELVEAKFNETVKAKIEKIISHDVRGRADTLIKGDILKHLMQEYIDKRLLIGKKYKDSDVLFIMTDMNYLAKLDEDTIAIPVFNKSLMIKPRKYWLGLNRQYPQITKAMSCFKNGLPMLYQLLNRKKSRNDTYVPASYTGF